MLTSLIMFVYIENILAIKFETGNYVPLKNCVAHTIANIFHQENFLLFLTDIGDEFAFPDTIKNPHVIANVNGFDDFVANTNVIAHFEYYQGLSEICVGQLQKNTILFITHYKTIDDIKNVFGLLWRCSFYNVVVIGYNYFFEPIAVYSDQFAMGNKCGEHFEQFIIIGCNSTKTVRFPNIFRKYPNCKLVYENNQLIEQVRSIKVNYTTYYLLEIIARKLNMTFKNEDVKIKKTSDFFVYPRHNAITDLSDRTTLPIYYDDTVWTVPAPKQIPPLTALKLIFKPLLWLFIATYLPSCFDAFFDVYSTTLLGSTTHIPTHSALRFGLITYVIYAIHIQTAFTSNLVKILTIPQYEPHIRNLEGLVESNLSILIRDDIFLWFNSAETKSDLQNTIYNKLAVLSREEFDNNVLGDDFNNCSSVWILELFKHYSRKFNKTFQYFADNTFTGTIKYSFSADFKVNIWYGFNRAVTNALETGLVDFLIKIVNRAEMRYKRDYGLLKIAQDDKIVITMEHACPVFAILCLGLSLSLIAFLIEALVDRYFLLKTFIM
ncbi:hypothetical protein FQR65_LT08705 [Abscondita terminalis]|nr:hypothetical protein FQR65_LT08705 [Abscondita terminalis]